MKIGVFACCLRAYGGGEKYVLELAQALAQENEVELLVSEDFDPQVFKSRLDIDLARYVVKDLRERYPAIGGLWFKRRLVKNIFLSRMTAKYDVIIYQSGQTEDLSYIFPSRAKKSVLLIQVPPRDINETLSKRLRLFCDPDLQTYDIILAYSEFTRRWIQKRFRRRVEVLYPPIKLPPYTATPKKKIILSVGRFFVGFHNKKQLELIRAFKQLYGESDSLEGWEFHLAGGTYDNVPDRSYKEECETESHGYPVRFHFNAEFDTLVNLYRRSALFWHATGLNEDEYKNPQFLEHFGMTTVEAMSMGCVPVVINKGGQKEIVRHGIDGFLWNTIAELNEYTLRLVENRQKLEKFRKEAVEGSGRFHVSKFQKKAKQLLT